MPRRDRPDYRQTLIDVTMTLRYDGTVNRQTLGRYIKEALQGWGGEKHPDDPLFEGALVRDLNMTNRRHLLEPPKAPLTLRESLQEAVVAWRGHQIAASAVVDSEMLDRVIRVEVESFNKRYREIGDAKV